MSWLRKPRLNKVVVTVATLTCSSCALMAGVNADMYALLEDVWLTCGRTKARLQEIEITTAVCLLNMAGEHPSVTAPIACGRWRSGCCAPGQFGGCNIQGDAAFGQVYGDFVTRLHQ